MKNEERIIKLLEMQNLLIIMQITLTMVAAGVEEAEQEKVLDQIQKAGKADGDSPIDTSLTREVLIDENERLRTALYQISEDAQSALTHD